MDDPHKILDRKRIAEYYRKLDDSEVARINALLKDTGWTVADIFRARYWECYDLEMDVKFLSTERMYFGGNPGHMSFDELTTLMQAAEAKKDKLLREGLDE